MITHTHISKFQLGIPQHLERARQESLVHSTRFIFKGTLAPVSPLTLGLGKMDGWISIFVPWGKSNA